MELEQPFVGAIGFVVGVLEQLVVLPLSWVELGVLLEPKLASFSLQVEL